MKYERNGQKDRVLHGERFEKGLQAGKKIDYEACNLCSYAGGCSYCIIYTGMMCTGGSFARASVGDFSSYCRFSSKDIRKWQTELKNRANKRLKDSGSKWRIAWERVK